MALGPITRLFSRHMYLFIQSWQTWNEVLPVSEGIFQELCFWFRHVEAFNGYPINRPLSCSATLTCDASESGYGAHVTFCNERKFCSGMWSVHDCVKSSTFRELKAVLLALESFSSFLQ